MASVVKYFVPNCGKFVNVVPAFKNGIDTLIACFKDPWGKTSGGVRRQKREERVFPYRVESCDSKNIIKNTDYLV